MFCLADRLLGGRRRLGARAQFMLEAPGESQLGENRTIADEVLCLRPARWGIRDETC